MIWEGVANPGDIVIVGDEAALTAGVQRIKDAGATDLEVAVFGSPQEVDRTIEFLATRPAGEPRSATADGTGGRHQAVKRAGNSCTMPSARASAIFRMWRWICS